jgi:hypothetical protein
MTPVFLSYANPREPRQRRFLDQVITCLQEELDLLPYTIGANVNEDPLPIDQINRCMHETHGLIAVAFRRTQIVDGKVRRLGKDGKKHEQDISGQWFTSPYCQIEPAMAYVLGLPVLMFRETGVVQEGLLETGAIPITYTDFDLSKPTSIDEFFQSDEWKSRVRSWERKVQQVRRRRGSIEILYDGS